MYALAGSMSSVSVCPRAVARGVRCCQLEEKESEGTVQLNDVLAVRLLPHTGYCLGVYRLEGWEWRLMLNKC